MIICRGHGRIISWSRFSSNSACFINPKGNEVCQHGSPSSNGRFPRNAFFINPFNSTASLPTRNFSSLSEKKTINDEDALEEGFSDLDSSPDSKIACEIDQKSDAELSSSESGEDEGIEDEEALGLAGGASSPKKTSPSPLFKVIVDASPLNINSALDEWVNAGNSLGRTEIYAAVLGLRRRRLFGKALQVKFRSSFNPFNHYHI